MYLDILEVSVELRFKDAVSANFQSQQEVGNGSGLAPINHCRKA